MLRSSTHYYSALAAVLIPLVLLVLFFPFMYFSSQSHEESLVQYKLRSTQINAEVSTLLTRVSALHREMLVAEMIKKVSDAIESDSIEFEGEEERGRGRTGRRMRRARKKAAAKNANKTIRSYPPDFISSLLRLRQNALVLVGKSHNLRLRLTRLERAQQRRERKRQRSSSSSMSSRGRLSAINHEEAHHAFGQRHKPYDPNRKKYFGKYQPDPRIEKLTFYKPSGIRNLSMTENELRPLAREARVSKGRLVQYSHSFVVRNASSGVNTQISTAGTIFVYNHSLPLQNRTECDVHYISLKYSRRCGDADLSPADVKPVLVVAVQRSGTHFVWEMLNRLSVHVHHEGVGPEGAVGWIYAVNAMTTVGKARSAGRERVTRTTAGGRGKGGEGIFGGSLRSLAAAAAATAGAAAAARSGDFDVPLLPFISSESDTALPLFPEVEFGVGKFAGRGYVINNPMRLSRQRFVRVLHQVRHPLRVISTLLVRCAAWDRYWTWIASVRGCEEITQQVTPLRRAMLLYIVWNRHIERYADLRFRTEVTSPRDVCLWAGFNKSRCSSAGQGSDGIVEPEVWAPREGGLERGNASTRRRLSAEPIADAEEQEEERDEHDEHEERDSSEGEEASSEEIEQERAQEKETPLDPALHVTWTDLSAESEELANELKLMCIEYGYPLDAELLPQSHASRAFTA